jgi:hypothetical protein
MNLVGRQPADAEIRHTFLAGKTDASPLSVSRLAPIA